MALRLLCGAECGIITAGASTGFRHWYGSSGSPAISTTTVRSGSKSYQFDAAATTPYLTYTLPASQSVVYGRLYVRLTNATPASNILVFHASGAGYNLDLRLSTGGVLQMTVNNGTATQNGPTLSNDTWYGVEFEMDGSANPAVVRWRTWASGSGWTSQTNVSHAIAATTFSNISVGIFSGPTSGTSLFIDDLIIGSGTTTGDDYSTSTSKGGSVLRYRPTSDGAHSSFTTGDFQYNGSVNIANTATDVYTYVDDDDQSSMSDYISQTVAGAGKYVRLAFANESTETDCRAVMVLMNANSAGAGANETHLRVSDDGASWTNIWGDWSTTGLDVAYNTSFANWINVLTTKPTGGAWTQSAVNSLEAQWGNSDDVAPAPLLHSLSLEVAWNEVTLTNAPGGNATSTGTSYTAGPTVKAGALIASAVATVSQGEGSDLLLEVPNAATATGAAYTGTPKPQPSAGVGTATGIAFQIPLGAAIGNAAATGSALTTGATVKPAAGAGSATGAASSAVPSLSPSAGLASPVAFGAAYQPTVDRATYAVAGVASATGGASGASETVKPSAGQATATQTTYGPGVVSDSATVVASGAALAQAEAVAVFATIGATTGYGSGSGAALDATVTTGITVSAESALATAAALVARAGSFTGPSQGSGPRGRSPHHRPHVVIR